MVAACGLIHFDVSQDIPAQTVPGSPLGGLLPAALFQFPLSIDLAQQTAAQKTGPAKSVTLKSITLQVTMPAGQDFSFLDSLSISIGGSGLPDLEIAHLSPVPAQPQISLTVVPGVDLLPYIKAGATLKASASGHAPAHDVTFDGKVVVTVHV
jgi:hypothetical protein